MDNPSPLVWHTAAGPRDPRLDHAFARVSGSPLREGNAVNLLRNAGENYPAWIDAIRAATRVIHFENFIIASDRTGQLFADALIERARAGVTVRVLYDWLGCAGRAFPRFWRRLEEGGVEVRVFNAPRLSAPFWVRRDHRKVITIDGRVGFVGGLCIADHWQGRANAEPWRDTGIELRGPVVADLDAAFAECWALAGSPLPESEIANPLLVPAAGAVAARVIRGAPGIYRTYRLDQLVAATARRTLWLTDAYFVPTTAYVQTLAEAARDGVDVRLLVPGTSDVPFLQPLVQAGYRSLIEAGIRVFEWNGSMLHAKTAVADGRWARVGSTNLNPTSWATNWEIDVSIEDEGFAGAMQAMFLDDLAHATEIVPGRRHPRARPVRARRASRPEPSYGGSMPRFAASAIKLGHTAGVAIAGSRTLSSTEARSAVTLGALLIALAAILTLMPQVLVAPIVFMLAWIGASLWLRAWRLRQASRRRKAAGATRQRASLRRGDQVGSDA